MMMHATANHHAGAGAGAAAAAAAAAFEAAQPAQRALVSQLAELVQESLANHMVRNATFFAERLVAADAGEQSKLLLANCYMRSNHGYRVYHLLKGSSSPASRYLFATAAVGVGKLAEAERALTGGEAPPRDGRREAAVAGGAAGRYLLGEIHLRTGRTPTAVENFCAALSMDPLMWCAYEALCQIGADEAVVEIVASVSGSVHHDHAGGGEGMMQASPAPGAHEPHHLQQQGRQHGQGTPAAYSPASSAKHPQRPFATPGSADFTTPSPSNFMTPAAGIAPAAHAPNHGAGNPYDQSADEGFRRRKFVDDGKMRKVSGRLFSGSSVRRSSRLASARYEGADADGAAGASTPAAAREEDAAPSAPAALRAAAGPAGAGEAGDGRQGSFEGTVRVWELIKVVIEGYRHLCGYRCHEALRVLGTLPHEQYHTPWVLCQVGRAKCELVDYHSACEVFNKVRRLAPWQLEGMEVYSTALWHLKREVELSYLAQEVVATDRLSPHAWCVVGNCFSLQKEHELALSYFQRALQLCPRFTYAHTLCGHEYFANEDFDKGLSCYRTAIAVDPLHYNAWYGLGTIYFRQEKYELAEIHFRRALDINPRSSVLSCYLGMALHKLQRNMEALGLLQDAITSDPKNPLAKFERACVLMSENHLSEALAELHELQQMAPKEATVYFQLGKVYKRLDRVDQAMIHFSMALDLKPSSADTNKIKAAIEGLHAPPPDDSDEDEL